MPHFAAAEPIFAAEPEGPARAAFLIAKASAEYMAGDPRTSLVTLAEALEMAERIDNDVIRAGGALDRGRDLHGNGPPRRGEAHHCGGL